MLKVLPSESEKAACVLYKESEAVLLILCVKLPTYESTGDNTSCMLLLE